jgi:hypothetical protein
MRYLVGLSTTCLLSVMVYITIFGLVVERPLVVDMVGAMLDRKLAYARSVPPPKIFILAGSNARVSHSCAVVEALLLRPCVNLGISVEVGLDWVVERARPYIRRGDVIYMPIEYSLYTQPRAQMYTGVDAAYRVRHSRWSLVTRGVEGTTRGIFMFTLPMLVHSLGEMALNAAGMQRRFGQDTLNDQGDEIGHTDEKAKAYENVIQQSAAPDPNPHTFMFDAEGTQHVISDFLDWCRQNGVIAVGGLQTTFDDRRIPDAVVSMLRLFYARHGAGFIELENRSQYPREHFYDTSAHLRQEAQRIHSDKIATALRTFLP